MVSIGILGYMNAGKTALFNLFRNLLPERGGNILGGQFGGSIQGNTVTVDFIRFISVESQQVGGVVHSLYGTGGHKHRVTDYYRSFVIRNADVFICMIDLSIDLKPQLDFYDSIELPVASIVLVFNKVDLVDEHSVSLFIEETVDFFLNKKKKLIHEQFITCAIPQNQYAQYNENAVKSVLVLCCN